MNILFTGLILFSTAFFLHLVIWRIKIPRRQTNFLSILFLMVLFFGVIFLFSCKDFIPGSLVFDNAFEYLHLCLFFISLTLAYITTYSAVEVDSPSLVLMSVLNSADRSGVDSGKIAKLVTNDKLVIPRVNDLVRDKLVYKRGGNYQISESGRRFVSVFILYRKFLGLGKGG